jgi:hypothetical protein
MKPEGWQKPTLRLVGDGVEESGDALNTSGLPRVASTTSHKIQSHQLSVSLNELENDLEDLVSRYFGVLDTLNIVMNRLVKLGLFTNEKDTTDKID